MSHNTLYLLLTSILVGILLGILGATAAHYFRTGIYFIEQFIESNFDLSDIVDARVEFGDLDGDEDLDFVIAGKNKEDESKLKEISDLLICKKILPIFDFAYQGFDKIIQFVFHFCHLFSSQDN